MTKFNPEQKEKLTYAEQLDPIFNITNQEEANQYLNDMVKFYEKNWSSITDSKGMTATEICKSNIGYYAGYSNDQKTRERIMKLFDCEHPFFGATY